MMVLFFKLIGSLMSLPVVGVNEPVAECNELHDNCGGGQVCQSGECVMLHQPKYCQVGDKCSTSCEPGRELLCSGETYVRVPNTMYDVCRTQAVVDFLVALDRKCRSVEKCSGEQFAALALAVDDLYKLLAEFHDLTSLHFPGGRPSGSWPSNEEQAYYVKRLQPHVPAYKQAEAIFVVATASLGSTRKANNEVSYARVQAAKKFMKLAAEAEGLSPVEVEAIVAKTRIAQIGDERQIDYTAYNSHFSQTTVAWNQKTELQLRGLLEMGASIKRRQDRRWRDRIINQTVFIVPVPCEVIQKDGSGLHG
ncbi:MAG: hypothetical protein ACPG4T_08885 [Nannocystaceae bacterium]